MMVHLVEFDTARRALATVCGAAANPDADMDHADVIFVLTERIQDEVCATCVERSTIAREFLGTWSREAALDAATVDRRSA
jgi:hypothetical protein